MKPRTPKAQPRPPFVLPWHIGPAIPKSEMTFATCSIRQAGRVIATVRGHAVREQVPVDCVEFPDPTGDGPEALAVRLLRGTGGVADAARLLGTAVRAVWALTEIAHANPAALRSLARLMPSWPVMVSPNPKRNEDPKPLLDSLQVGQGLPTAEDSQSRANVDDTAAQAARSLIDYIRLVRDYRHVPPMEPDDWTARARALPPLAKDTAPLWWGVAELALRETYPDPLAVRELKALVPKSRKAPSRARATLLAILASRFRAMAKPA